MEKAKIKHRKIAKEQRRKIPIAVMNEQNEVVGAQLVEEDTYRVVQFTVDLVNNRIVGLVARGFLNARGEFEYQPQNTGQWSLTNEAHQEGPRLFMANFIKACGGNTQALTAEQFLDYIIDVMGFIPSDD